MGATVLRYVIRAGDKDFRAILGTMPKDINAIYASVWAPDAAERKESDEQWHLLGRRSLHRRPLHAG